MRLRGPSFVAALLTLIVLLMAALPFGGGPSSFLGVFVREVEAGERTSSTGVVNVERLAPFPERSPFDADVAVVGLSPRPRNDAGAIAPKEVIGLYYFRNRYLDPEQGRFVSRDPIGIWGDPENLGNGYAFAGGNPVNRRDPFGLFPEGARELPSERGGGLTDAEVEEEFERLLAEARQARASQPVHPQPPATVPRATSQTNVPRAAGIGVVGGLAVVGGYAFYQRHQMAANGELPPQEAMEAAAKECAKAEAALDVVRREHGPGTLTWVRIFKMQHKTKPNAAAIDAFNGVFEKTNDELAAYRAAEAAYWPGEFAAVLKAYKWGEASAATLHEVYLRSVARDPAPGRFATSFAQGKFGVRIFDHYDPCRKIGYEANTTPWGQMTWKKFNDKMTQIAKDADLLKRNPDVERVIWFGTEPLPDTGYGGLIKQELAKQGIPYHVVPAGGALPR